MKSKKYIISNAPILKIDIYNFLTMPSKSSNMIIKSSGRKLKFEFLFMFEGFPLSRYLNLFK
jgi:hypothetical protein